MQPDAFTYINKCYAIPNIPYVTSMGIYSNDLDLLNHLRQFLGKFFNQSITEGGITYYWVDASTLLPMCKIFNYSTRKSVCDHLNILCGQVKNGLPAEGFKREDYPLIKIRVVHAPPGGIPRQRSYYAIRTSVIDKFIKDISYMPYADFCDNFQSIVNDIEDKANSEPDETFDDTEAKVETPVEDATVIRPETIDFIEKVLEANPSAFSKPRINLEAPSKSLIKLQEVLSAVLSGTFVETYRTMLPKNVQEVSTAGITVQDLLQYMGGFSSQGRKIAILDYFLSYNVGTKKYHSILLSYLSKQESFPRDTLTNSTSVTTGSIPNAIKEWRKRKEEAGVFQQYLTRSGVSDTAIMRVASILYEWYEDNGHVFTNRASTMRGLTSWRNVLNRMFDFVSAGFVEKIDRTAVEFFNNVQPFNTANKEWLMFARWVRHHLNGPTLSSKIHDKYIDLETGSWYYINYRELIPDID